jgi:hypothetical protein
MDWNIRSKDQAYSRFSYLHVPGNVTPPLGPLLDGSVGFKSGSIPVIGESFMASETHFFNPSFSNEFRFA